MYDQKNLTYVLTALEAIEKCFSYVTGLSSPEDFFDANNQMNFNACQILLLTIGEESKKLDQALKDQAPQIPWPQIYSLRNRIAHDYRGIDPYISYDVITNYLPDLKTALVNMIPSISFEWEVLLNALNSPFYKNIQYLRKESPN